MWGISAMYGHLKWEPVCLAFPTRCSSISVCAAWLPLWDIPFLCLWQWKCDHFEIALYTSLHLLPPKKPQHTPKRRQSATHSSSTRLSIQNPHLWCCPAISSFLPLYSSPFLLLHQEGARNEREVNLSGRKKKGEKKTETESFYNKKKKLEEQNFILALRGDVLGTACHCNHNL